LKIFFRTRFCSRDEWRRVEKAQVASAIASNVDKSIGAHIIAIVAGLATRLATNVATRRAAGARRIVAGVCNDTQCVAHQC
jgi:basic membrane lipoprotein Med (substrate-binding protein (PBP1-ABC) superfamily)